ncbi:hypothetical protein PISMIDRAFT_403406, partial [Pisolithus microcarpus 441]
MDYPPELADNGYNWMSYGNSVLCTINDEGLMGFLVGSERRPTHPAELEGRGEGWTPQTDEERDEVAIWRTADQSWTQRNAMVNYTIICRIPDTIFSSMLYLKSPLEKWDYLENHFGRIPRPESWLAAERAMQQSDPLPEQSAAGETAQSTCDSNHEPEILPIQEEGLLDGPNDCAETESGYLTPETEVVDAQHVEPYLLEVVEVGDAGGMRLDECTKALEAPDKGSQCTSNKVEESKDLPKLSSEALETQEDLPFTTSERAETRAGHRKLENEVVDTRHVVDVLPMFEVGSTGQAWYDKHVKELKAPDERWDQPDTTSEHAETKTGHMKPETEVVDVRQAADILSKVEVGAVDLIQPDEHANALETPDEGCQHASNEVEDRWDLPGLSSKALEPEGDTTRQASGHSMEDVPRIPFKEDRCTWMNGDELILDIPDPPGTHTEHPVPHIECPTSQNRSLGRMRSTTTTPYAGKSDKLQDVRSLELHCKQASRRPHETYQVHPTCETLPNEARRMGVLSSPGVGWGDGMAVEATVTTLEIRAISVKTAEIQPHLLLWDITPKVPDKAEGAGGGDSATSSEFCDSLRAEKPVLADSGSQHIEEEVKQSSSLPALPRPLLNAIRYTHRPSTDSQRPGRVKTSAESVSKARTRQNAYLILMWPLLPLSTPSKRLRHPMGGSWMMERGYNKVRHASRVRTRGLTYRGDHIHGSLAISTPNEVLRHLWNVANTYWHQGVPPRSICSADKLTNSYTASWQPWYMAKRGLRHRARLRSNAENESWQAERSMAVRNQPTWDNLHGKEGASGGGHDDAPRSGYV